MPSYGDIDSYLPLPGSVLSFVSELYYYYYCDPEAVCFAQRD